MNLTVSQEQGRIPVTVVRIEGRVNLGSADALRESARTAVENGTRDMLIDLAAVPSMTTEGLRAIHAIYLLLDEVAKTDSAEGAVSQPNQTIRVSRHLKLLNPSPHVHNVLNIAGFTEFIEVYDNQQAAIASF
jgi:anti-anti-sigma regulatory factor